MVSVDVYREVLINGDIYRNVIEGHTKDYPQYQVGIASIRQWMLLAELSLCNDVVVATDDNGNQGYCIYCVAEDPHVHGKVLFMQMTLSCSSACTKAIIKHLKEEAYASGCSWIWISRRSGEYSYTGTFHKLRNTNG